MRGRGVRQVGLRDRFGPASEILLTAKSRGYHRVTEEPTDGDRQETALGPWARPPLKSRLLLRGLNL